MKSEEILQEGIGRKIVFWGRAANMISLMMSPTKTCPFEYSIHIQSDAIVIFNGNLYTSTEDMIEYQQQNETKYDERVHELINSNTDFILQQIFFDENNSLHVYFSNALEIHTLFDPTLPNPKTELWRVFLPWKAAPHLVATALEVTLEFDDMTQEELNILRADLQKRKNEDKGTAPCSW